MQTGLFAELHSTVAHFAEENEDVRARQLPDVCRSSHFPDEWLHVAAFGYQTLSISGPRTSMQFTQLGTTVGHTIPVKKWHSIRLNPFIFNFGRPIASTTYVP